MAQHNSGSVKVEPGLEKEEKPVVALPDQQPAEPSHALNGSGESVNNGVAVKKEHVVRSKRITGDQAVESLGKSVTVLGQVLHVVATGEMMKVEQTTSQPIMAFSQLPMPSNYIGKFVEMKGLLDKKQSLKIQTLHIFDEKIYMDMELSKEGCPKVYTFDKSVYNEMVELLHSHAEYFNFKDKMDHFGTEDLSDERKVQTIDLSSDQYDFEDDYHGFTNHSEDSVAVEEILAKRAADQEAMEAEFVGSSSDSVVVIGTVSNTKIEVV